MKNCPAESENFTSVKIFTSVQPNFLHRCKKFTSGHEKLKLTSAFPLTWRFWPRSGRFFSRFSGTLLSECVQNRVYVDFLTEFTLGSALPIVFYFISVPDFNLLLVPNQRSQFQFTFGSESAFPISIYFWSSVPNWN